MAKQRPTSNVKFYKLPELAEATGLSVEHFRRLCQAEVLKAIKPGGPTSPWLIRHDWFDDWVEANVYRAST